MTKANMPWSLKGVSPEARNAAKAAAKAAGKPLGEWLTETILKVSTEEHASDPPSNGNAEIQSPGAVAASSERHPTSKPRIEATIPPPSEAADQISKRVEELANDETGSGSAKPT